MTEMLPDELSHLITAFLPSQSSTTRSKAYLTLSAFCQGVRSSSSSRGENDSSRETVLKAFGPSILSRLADTEENELLASICFLTALFQVDSDSAIALFSQDGILDSIMDSVDLNPSPPLAQNVAHLLSQVCGHKASRNILTPQTVQWLEHASCGSSDKILRAGAIAALIKLSKGSSADREEASGNGIPETDDPAQGMVMKDADLAAAMKEIVVSGSDQTSISHAVEGLAYLSVDPAIKEALSRDSTFLQRLFALVPRGRNALAEDPAEVASVLIYGILVIVSNLCTYRRRLSEEEAQIQKLRQMANAKNRDTPSGSSALDDDENVRIRIRRLLDCGLLDVFAPAVHIDSLGIRLTSGKVLLSIIEDQGNRGRVLQSGCAKVLRSIIKRAIPSSSSKSLKPDPSSLAAIQALAKLAITSSPVQVFGPDEGAMYDVIRPLSFLLQGDPSNLLQRFESMMALTNLSSQSAELASRIAKSEGLLNRVELLLLEEHVLVRRAAMELLCNLIVGSEVVFERYGGGDDSLINNAKPKLQVVLALSDVDDLPTRLAASGALAALTSASKACQALVMLQLERHRVFPIITRLIDPSVSGHDQVTDEKDNEPKINSGLRHRGIICTRNIFLNISDKSLRPKMIKEAEESNLIQALVNFVAIEGESAGESLLLPAQEVLRVITEK